MGNRKVVTSIFDLVLYVRTGLVGEKYCKLRLNTFVLTMSTFAPVFTRNVAETCLMFEVSYAGQDIA